MASSDQTINVTQNKLCSRCTKRKTLSEFIRFHGSQEKEFSTCNVCSEKKKGKRPLEFDPISEDNSSETLNQPQDDNNDLEEINDNEDEVLYELVELEELVTRYFSNVEENEVNFSGTFEFENELIEDFQVLNNDHDNTVEDRIHDIIYHFLLPIEAGSLYYWEIRKIYFHKKKTEQATVYLGCTQRIDRKTTQPDNRPVKRISEARLPIDRYECEGKIIINVDINMRQAKVTIQHLMTHEYPTYRENKLPEKAIAWISENLKLRKVEVYKSLCENQLIDSRVHTYRQVYYWSSKFSAQRYLTNASNQLLSSLNFLGQSELVNEGYKVMLYLENDFVRALGFLTPFYNYIQKDNINEIVIDSTFKTNQEKFELFVVLINHGGYGVPLAYLYVDTFTAPEDRLQDPRNRINSRVKVLREFFLSLRSEGVLPTFVLVDKDAGQIAAIQEAWSWTTNIQLCLWHVERAIDRKLKEKKYKLSRYTAQRAKEANEQFDFIDASWIPEGCEGVICSGENIKEILNMVKRHALLHPLIPINKEIFLTSTEIYHQSVTEIYRYCREKDLVRLWGYLWTNWYNKADWNLFARASFPRAIPLARTTMLVESHWRVLKYNYKYNCNRPRLDRLTQILTKELIPDQIRTWQKFNNNRAFPSWWVAFKSEWKTALDKDIDIDSEDKYLTDINNWFCSCPAFMNDAYNVCKHLVKKYTNENPTFFPQYTVTKRRHDYPLICFDEAHTSIDLTNNPWTEAIENSMDESDSPVNEDGIINLSLHARNELIESRKSELEEDKKIFESLLEIASNNIENDHFYNVYKRLKQTLIIETKACQEALASRMQQRTWNPPRNSKLAFTLN
jgi:hypothetical protein